MKTNLLLAIIILVAITGCGNVAGRNAQIAANNALIMASISAQTTALAENRASMMASFSAAAMTAAETMSETDDVLIAFAWGREMARQAEVVVPQLQAPVEEKDATDYMLAFTPYANMLMPFAYNAWGNDSKKTSTSLTAGNDIFYISGDGGAFDYSPYTDQGYESSVITAE